MDGLYGDIQKEYGQLKGRVKDHEELTSQIRTMAGYIERSNIDSNQPVAVKTKDDANTRMIWRKQCRTGRLLT